MIYFTADNHFCHGNIIGSCHRPFSNVNEMNEAMINNWNNLITIKDEVYILGDFAYKGKTQEVNNILSRLKGKKYLVKGNHDKYLNDPLFNSNAFDWVKDYFILKYEGLEVVLFHYPMLSWYKSHYGSVHLYGHVHNSTVKYPEFADKIKILGQQAINVGVDVNDFYPVSIKQIINKIKEAKDENNKND
jgi:calcineurin-like phosphoesterase family protein